MKVKKIAVIGAGLMGAGISYVSRASGYDVVMTDLDDDAINRGMSRLNGYVESGIKRMGSVMSRLASSLERKEIDLSLACLNVARNSGVNSTRRRPITKI